MRSRRGDFLSPLLAETSDELLNVRVRLEAACHDVNMICSGGSTAGAVARDGSRRSRDVSGG